MASATGVRRAFAHPGDPRDGLLDLGRGNLHPVANHDVLHAPDDAHPAAGQFGHVAGAEPFAVECLRVVIGIGVAEECVRPTDAALGRIRRRADPHLDVGQRHPVVGVAHRPGSVRRPDVLTGTSDEP